MADIDPYAQLQQLTPRGASVVDAIADARRVIDASIRTNPLTNAHVDEGLMVWRGNYAGQGGIKDSYLWIGEVTPADVFLNRQQRAFLVTRDDPRHAPAFWMYDPFPDEQGLRQVIRIQDSDGAAILIEDRAGGLSFPFGQVNLYPTAFIIDAAGPAVTSPAFKIPHTSGGSVLVWEGYGPMMGSQLKIWLNCLAFPAGAGGYAVYAHIDWDGALNGGPVPSFDTGSVAVPDGSQGTSFFVDLDFSGQGKVGREVHVQIFAIATTTSGTGEWGVIFPRVCYTH